MKRLSILYAVIAVSLSLASCSGRGNQTPETSDSIKNEVEADTITSKLSLTENGIGDVTLGMAVADIPESINGLYDRVDRYDGKSFTGFSFVKDSIEVFNAEDTDFDGKLNLIALRGDSPLKAETDRGVLYIGFPEDSLLNNGEKAPEGGLYHIGNFRVEVQDCKVDEIYIEWSPETAND